MNRIDRLMGILTTLQSKKYTTAEHLSETFEISVRTVYRDIKALGEIGIPVSFEAGKGYFITQGYFLSPVSFTVEEANALILMETLAQRYGDRSIKHNYETALSKIKAVLRGNTKDDIDYLHSQIKVWSHTEKNNDFNYLSEIQNAIQNRTLLTIGYENLKKEQSKRDIEPIGLLFYGDNWHLIAWCWHRQEYRDFRVSRIQDMRNTMQPFRKNEHINLSDYVEEINRKIEEMRNELP
jgi:predicted DNA-binding transcriptional regulator YafY